MIVIGKARKRPKTRPHSIEAKRMNAIADTMASAVQGSLTKGIKKFRSRVGFEKIATAYETGTAAEVLGAIPFDKLSTDLSVLSVVLEDGIIAGATNAKDFFPVVSQPNITFDVNNPRVAAFINTHTAKLIDDATDNTIKAVQAIVKSNLDRGIPARRAAREISAVVGLSERQALTVARFHAGLLEQGVKASVAETRMLKFAEKKVTQRAKVIARTESLRAVNAGHQEIWRQSVDQGLFEKVEKKWVIDPGTACELCEPQQGQTVGINESFDTPVGPVDVPTDIHPQCNCMMEFVIQ